MYAGPMRGRFSRYIGPGPGELRKGPWISEGPLSLSHRHFIFIFSYFVWYFQLFLVCLDMLTGHSVAQEIKHLWKFTSGFIWPQISVCPRGPKAVLFRIAKFLLKALYVWHYFHKRELAVLISIIISQIVHNPPERYNRENNSQL
jgi:hypothetical protein